MTRRDRVRNSALWAAWGDAVGFISELAPDTKTLRRRLGDVRVTGTTSWVRRLGGQYGIDAKLPAGCYSDDTQLRLATSRAIRGDGRFDVRGFAKVELVVWQAYALGGGRSTQAAATSLRQESRDWLSNFYGSGSGPRYEEAGGNGAAMRIQPHVWAARDLSSPSSFLQDVIRNSVVTHGHPRALVGAALHAVSLARALESGEIPDPGEWGSLLDRLEVLASVVHEDEELHTLWLPGWARRAQRSVDEALAVTIDECRQELEIVGNIARTDPRTAYEEIIIATRATQEATRGSATKTATLALALAWLGRDRPAEALIEAANALGTDTDTIASMAGALLGIVCGRTPPGPTLDTDYLCQEADRIASIAEGTTVDTFGYPDPLRWAAPRSPVDAVGTVGGHLALAGLGPITLDGPEWRDHSRAPTVWQWARLDFGQSVLIRRRPNAGVLPPPSVARSHAVGDVPEGRERQLAQQPVLLGEPKPATSEVGRERKQPSDHFDAHWLLRPTVDDAFEEVRAREFEPTLVGRYLLEFSTRSSDGHALAMAFAAMVSKAWRSRRTRA